MKKIVIWFLKAIALLFVVGFFFMLAMSATSNVSW